MQTKGSSKLTVNKRKELVLALCGALSVLRSSEEVAEALTDLLTPKEIETIAKRLQIAELLVEGADYGSIRTELKVGYSTIARVNTWLNISGVGFKVMLSRRPKRKQRDSEEERYDPYSWHNIKRRHSVYFWPQLLIEELFKQSSNKERRKIEEIFDKLQVKGERFTREENKHLYAMFSGKSIKPKAK